VNGGARQPPPALILAAGLGTRLHPLTLVRAKPAVPVNGQPLVRRILSWLASHGVRDTVINLHHRPESIAAVVGDGADLGVRVRYSWEQPVLGSAGGPRRALPLLTDGGAGRFLLVNGDTLSTVAIDALLDRHERSGATVTLALIPNPNPDKYGGVRLSDRGYVTGFTTRGTPGPSFHFIGVQVAEGRTFAPLVDGVPAESVNMLYPRLIADDAESVAGFVSDAAFNDIGTPRDYLDTSLALASIEGPRLTGERVTAARSAEIIRTALWDDVTVSADVRLTDCIVCDGVRLAGGSAYERCAITLAGGASPLAGDRIEGDLLIRAL
jgi:NDP-sugar pyrophosphorylase family protein